MGMSDKLPRRVVRCKTGSDLDELIRWCSDKIRPSKFDASAVCWSTYGADTAVLLSGWVPVAFGAEDFYQKNYISYGKPEFYSSLEEFFSKYDPSRLADGSGIAEVEDVGENNPDEPSVVCNISTYRYAVITTSKGSTEVSEEEFQSNAKMQRSRNVKHYVRAVITLGDSAQASATCEANAYDERQGILEAMGNLLCQNSYNMPFEAFFRQMLKERQAHEQYIRKCPLCGTVYSTPAKVEDCMRQHVEAKRARAERWRLHKIARRELAAAAERERIDAIKAQILYSEKASGGVSKKRHNQERQK